MADSIQSFYISDSFDPTLNLAFEEVLLSECKKNEIIFFLWQNEKTVVIGKHQNPYKECSIDRIKKDDITLVRRFSGGGAVYHDGGNLNFTFICHKDMYNVERQLGVILDSIKEFGIEGEMSGRNDLTCLGKKFSGNAFMNRGDFYCHHGTILVNSKLENLVKYLTPPEIKITSKGLDSVRSRVTNLNDFNKNLTCSALTEVLFNTFSNNYKGLTSKKSFNSDSEKLINLKNKYRSWDWNFSESPKCKISHTEKFSWGTFGIDMDIEDGIITKCYINTDAIGVNDFDGFNETFINLEAKFEVIMANIDKNMKSEKIVTDLESFFKVVLV